MHRYDVRACAQLFQRDAFRVIHRFSFINDHAATQRSCYLSDLPADISVSRNAPGLPCQFMHDRHQYVRRSSLCVFSAPDCLGVFREMISEIKHHCRGQLSHAVGGVTHYVAYCDAVLSAVLDINVVVSGRRDTDKLQRTAPAQRIPFQFHLVDNSYVAVLQMLRYLFLGGVAVYLDFISVIRQRRQIKIVPQRRLIQHRYLHKE